MLQLFLLILLDGLILQPIKIVLNKIVSKLPWLPPVSNSYILQQEVISKEESDSYRDECILNKELREFYNKSGDGAKFLGMIYYATKNESDWKNVISLVQNDGFLKRNNDPDYDNSVTFSGDMLAGFLLAITDRLDKLTDEEKTKLSKAWNESTFTGWPLLIKGIDGKKIFQRGHIYRPHWVIDNSDILTSLLWLYLGYKITNKKSYKFFYYMMKIINLPTMFLCKADTNLFYGKTYGVAWHTEHSNILIYFSGYNLLKTFEFKKALKEVVTKHSKYNADSLAIGMKTNILERSDEHYILLDKLLYSAKYKGTKDITPMINTKYLSLIFPPEKVIRADHILFPIHAGNDYSWERSPIKGKMLTDEERRNQCLDFLFPASIRD